MQLIRFLMLLLARIVKSILKFSTYISVRKSPEIKHCTSIYHQCSARNVDSKHQQLSMNYVIWWLYSLYMQSRLNINQLPLKILCLFLNLALTTRTNQVNIPRYVPQSTLDVTPRTDVVAEHKQQSMWPPHQWISDCECDRWMPASSSARASADGVSSLCARCTFGVTRVRAVGTWWCCGCCSCEAKGTCSSFSVVNPIIRCCSASSSSYSSSWGTLTVTLSGSRLHCWSQLTSQGCSFMTSLFS